MFSSLGYTAVTFTVGALAQFAPYFIWRASCIVDHPYSEGEADLLFGGVTVLAGIFGTLSGSELSKFLGRYTRKAEAIVCTLGVAVGTPCLYLALTVVQYRIMPLAWVSPTTPGSVGQGKRERVRDRSLSTPAGDGVSGGVLLLPQLGSSGSCAACECAI